VKNAAFTAQPNIPFSRHERARDGSGMWDVDKFSITADSDAGLVLMEVPMKI